MECKRIQELLSPYLDKNLTEKEIALVEEHLRACPRCPQELERLKRTVHLVSSLEEVEPPESFLSEIHRKLKAKSRRRRFFDKLFFPLPVKLPLEALAAVLIAVVIVSLNRPYPPGPAPREMAQRLPEGLEVEEGRKMVAEEADNYQIQVATENIPLGLLKAQKVIYLNEGNIINPSDEDMLAQINSIEIRRSQILFEMPPQNYDRVLDQLKEVGKITSIIPLEKMEKSEVRLKKKEDKPSLINVQLELTHPEKE